MFSICKNIAASGAAANKNETEENKENTEKNNNNKINMTNATVMEQQVCTEKEVDLDSRTTDQDYKDNACMVELNMSIKTSRNLSQ